MATPKKATSAKAWKGANQGIDLELPSGNVCLVKRPGIEEILGSGVIPDELSDIAMKNVKKTSLAPQDHKKPGGEPAGGLDIDPKEFQKVFKTTDDVFRLMDSFDRITEMCVLEPKVVWHKREVLGEDGKAKRTEDGVHIIYETIPLTERDDEILYTDVVDMDDKMFIFNFVVGGSSDLEQFRAEYGDSLASLSAG